MALQGELALLDLVVPHFDQVIVATRHEHRLGLVEVDAANGTCFEQKERSRLAKLILLCLDSNKIDYPTNVSHPK